MNKFLSYTTIGLLFVTAGVSAVAQKSINTSLPFLQVTQDARAAAMGDVGIATSPDANALFWNQSKAAFDTGKASIAASYSPWLKEIADNVFMASVAGSYKLNDHSALSVGMRYFDMGSINTTNDGQTSLGVQHPKQYTIDAGYALKLSPHFGLGVSFRYIHSILLNGNYAGKSYKSGSAFAGDVSLYYNKLNSEGQGFTAGAAITNIGSKISYTNDGGNKYLLPANLGIGAAYTWALEGKNKLTLAADVNHLLVPKMDSSNMADYYNKGVFGGMGSSFGNSALQAAAGAEYVYNDQFFLRAGYHWESATAGDLQYFTAGLGVKFNSIGLNFSYAAPSGSGLNKSPVSNTLRFGFLYSFSR